jgi:CxxC motif-containing protein
MEDRKLTCIVCPIGCQLNITFDGDKIDTISGNRCKRGSAYAREECTAPRRMLTTTVKVAGGLHPLVPVKTEKAVPKQLIMQCMDEIHKLQVTAPIKVGDIILVDICGTGVNMVATGNNPRA